MPRIYYRPYYEPHEMMASYVEATLDPKDEDWAEIEKRQHKVDYDPDVNNRVRFRLSGERLSLSDEEYDELYEEELESERDAIDSGYHPRDYGWSWATVENLGDFYTIKDVNNMIGEVIIEWVMCTVAVAELMDWPIDEGWIEEFFRLLDTSEDGIEPRYILRLCSVLGVPPRCSEI